MMPVLLFAVASLLASTDANREGFAAYQKGQLALANKLFHKAVQQDPKNAYAWLNLARTTSRRLGDTEPKDPCALAHNWVYLSLAYLDRAMQLDAAAIGPKLADDTTGLAHLKKREEFAAWQLAVQPLPKGDAAIRSFLQQHNFFWASVGVLEGLTLEKDGTARYGIPGSEAPIGAWAVVKGAVEIRKGEKLARRYRLTVQPWAFGEGKYSYRRVVLEQDGTQEGPDLLEYGPMMDCGDGGEL